MTLPVAVILNRLAAAFLVFADFQRGILSSFQIIRRRFRRPCFLVRRLSAVVSANKQVDVGEPFDGSFANPAEVTHADGMESQHIIESTTKEGALTTKEAQLC